MEGIDAMEEPVDLYNELQSRKLLIYGAGFSGELLREILGIDEPDTAPKAEYQRLALIELQNIGRVRDRLLSEGKYLAGVRGNYRILLPHENEAQVQVYLLAARKKLQRGDRLLDATAPQYKSQSSHITARMSMILRGVNDRDDLSGLTS